MIKNSKSINKCQLCKSNKLEPIIFLGYLPPVNHLKSLNKKKEEDFSFPLELIRCKSCGLVQINLEIKKEFLFPYSYPYLSGTTKILIDNFQDLYKQVNSLNLLNMDDLVVDIGSNDGSLLESFKNAGHRVLGVEPSKASSVAKKKKINTMNSYFTDETVSKIIKKFGKAKIITAANVFAHISNPKKLVKLISNLLENNGFFISESHYLPSLVETLQYDTIYHEHLRYYHLDVFHKLFENTDLKIVNAKKIPTHGGSIRVFAQKTSNNKIKVNKIVNKIIEKERSNGICNGSAFSSFKEKIIKSKLDLLSLISKIKKPSTKIYGIGAPSRASTLISYTGIDDGILDCVLELKNSHKLNKFMPGTKIPILDEQKLFSDQPDYALLLSWHISKSLIKNLKKKGYKGKFIIPLPTPKIV